MIRQVYREVWDILLKIWINKFLKEEEIKNMKYIVLEFLIQNSEKVFFKLVEIASYLSSNLSVRILIFSL